MTAPAFRRDRNGGVVVLTLDTPGGAANVFTRDAAAQLTELLEESRAADVRAVVLRSGKRRSFVNGVGLLMAGTLKSAADAERMTAPVRDAYRALRECPVPTIAAIEGNCYGCGVELVTQCRFRVAADSFDTHFFMTELAEYLFVPTFGGTQDLPGLLGLTAAAEFVLWGPRWPVRRALAEGLVDRCFAPQTFEQDLERFVADVVAEGPAAGSRRRKASTIDERAEVTSEHRRRIARLPPAYREVYETGLALLTAGSVQPPNDLGYAREARAAALSIMQAPCRAAWPFFFVRQVAQAVATGAAPRSGARGFTFTAADEAVADLARELSWRCEPALRAPEGARSTLMLCGHESARRDVAPADTLVAVSTTVAGAPGPSMVTAHLPFRAAGLDVVEVATPAGASSGAAQALACALADAGFTVIRTSPKEAFVLDDLLLAWLAPLVSYLAGGGEPADLACSLRAFGFTRLPGDWLGNLDAAALAEALAPRLPRGAPARELLASLPSAASADGRLDAGAIDGLLASLGAFAARAIGRGVVPHASYVDVAARDALDFPLLHTSLCRHLTVARIRDLLQSRSSLRRLVDDGDVALLEEFVSHGRDYYAAPRLAPRLASGS